MNDEEIFQRLVNFEHSEQWKALSVLLTNKRNQWIISMLTNDYSETIKFREKINALDEISGLAVNFVREHKERINQ